MTPHCRSAATFMIGLEKGGMAVSAAAAGLVSTFAATGAPTRPDFPAPCRLPDGADGLEA